MKSFSDRDGSAYGIDTTGMGPLLRAIEVQFKALTDRLRNGSRCGGLVLWRDVFPWNRK
jgi:hypothetical protein